MKFSVREYRAIGYCAKKYDQRLSLCRYPVVFYVKRDTGETLKIDIKEVLAVYDEGRKEDAKERARIRQLQKV